MKGLMLTGMKLESRCVYETMVHVQEQFGSSMNRIACGPGTGCEDISMYEKRNSRVGAMGEPQAPFGKNGTEQRKGLQLMESSGGEAGGTVVGERAIDRVALHGRECRHCMAMPILLLDAGSNGLIPEDHGGCRSLVLVLVVSRCVEAGVESTR